MNDNEQDEREQAERQQVDAFRDAVLPIISASKNANATLFVLLEMAGLVGSVILLADRARLPWIVAMIDALKARILADAAKLGTDPEVRH